MKKPEKESVQTAIRLPRQTHEWLQKQPAGITDSIKRGLELLEIEEDADEPTREFALLMFALAREVALETGAAWHVDGKAHRTFRRAILVALSKWRPADYEDNLMAEVLLPPFQDRLHASHPINDADELGIWLAKNALDMPDRDERQRVRSAREVTLKEMVKLQQTRGDESND